MDDKTTTEAPVEVEGAPEAQPQQADQAPAVETQDAPSEDTTQTPSEPSSDDATTTDSGYDEDTLKWFESKGIDPTAPDPAKLAKMAREAERNMHQKTQKASELEKSINTQVEDVAQQQGKDPDVVRLIVKDTVREFYDQHPDAREHEAEMVQELGQRPHLVGDLEALYAVVKSRNDNSASLRSEGSREALETLANKQRATAPSGAAVNSQVNTQSKITRQLINQKMQAGDYTWLEKNNTEIDRLAAEGLLQ